MKEVVVQDGEDGSRAIREDLVQRKLGSIPAPVLFAEDSVTAVQVALAGMSVYLSVCMSVCLSSLYLYSQSICLLYIPPSALH